MMQEDKRKIEVHIHDGGQFNLAMDNAQIEAHQNIESGLDEEVIQTFLDVINGKEYIHKILKNGKEKCRIATEDDVEDFPDEIIKEHRKQLGMKQNGNESKLQIISKLLQEMEETLHTGKRYGVMPIFSYVSRGTINGYLFLDNCVMAFENVDIQEYYWDAYDKYVIENEYYHFIVLLYDGQVVYIELGYTLCFSDVTERLCGFRKTKELINAKKIELLLSKLNKKIEINMLLLGEGREEQIAITDYWIEQMSMVDAIEKYFKIKFHLPQKASDEDYQTIYALYNSINKFKTSTFPALSVEKELFRKTFRIKNEILINDGSNFLPLDLFGYHFQPIAVYMMECTLIWKKKIRAWEVNEGGVPVRVEFICYRK